MSVAAAQWCGPADGWFFGLANAVLGYHAYTAWPGTAATTLAAVQQQVDAWIAPPPTDHAA
jgi:hypothetical protein